MAGPSMITNPRAVFKTVSDHTTGRDSSGEPVGYFSIQGEFLASAAVARGEAVMWVTPATATPTRVTPMTAAAADNLFAGVAFEAIASGETGRIVHYGFAIGDVAAETAAFGSLLTAPATTTGKLEIGATEDATLVVSSVVGVAWGAKDSSNLAPCWINHR